MFREKSQEKFTAIDPLDRKFTQPSSSIKKDAELAGGSGDDSFGVVHTMPKRFLRAPSADSASNQPRSKRTKIILVIIIGVLVVGIAGGSAYFFSALDSKNNAVVPATNQNTNARVGFSNANTNSANTNGNTNAANGNQNKNTNGATGNTNKRNSNTNSNASNINGAVETASSLDTDKDALTDIEEELYGTRFQKTDSDSDGFLDGDEVSNLYDPLGSGTLDHSPQVAKYSNVLFSYTVLYPSAFTAEATSNAQDTILFTSATGEFIETLTQPNPDSLTARQWYLLQFPDEVNPKSVTNKQGLVGVLSVDGLTAYFADKKYIYAVSYHVGAREEHSFATTFTMMYQSLDFVAADSTLSPTSNTNARANSNTNSKTNGNSNSGANKNGNGNANKNSNTNNKNTL